MIFEITYTDDGYGWDVAWVDADSFASARVALMRQARMEGVTRKIGGVCISSCTH